MKFTSKPLILIFAILTLTASTYSQTRAELAQLVTQLQTTPGDNALREKIIKLAPTVKPAPVVSDEAIRFEGRGQAAFADAKSEADYVAAAREYEKAVSADPWVGLYYSHLCTIYEKAGKLEDAKRHCGFYLIVLTDPTQIIEVKRRIAGLEFKIEKATTEKAEAEKAAQVAKVRAEAEAAERDRFRPTVEGKWTDGAMHFYIVRNGERFTLNLVSFFGYHASKMRATNVELNQQRIRFTFEQPMCPKCGIVVYDLSLSPSGSELSGSSYGSYDDKTYEAKFRREP